MLAWPPKKIDLPNTVMVVLGISIFFCSQVSLLYLMYSATWPHRSFRDGSSSGAQSRVKRDSIDSPSRIKRDSIESLFVRFTVSSGSRVWCSDSKFNGSRVVRFSLGAPNVVKHRLTSVAGLCAGFCRGP